MLSRRNWFWREIVFTDLSRGPTYAIILLVIDSVLIGADIFRLAQGRFEANRAFYHLFIAHIVLFALLALFLLINYALRAESAEQVSDRHAALLIVFAGLLLAFSTAVSMIDQAINGQITIYVMGCLILSAAFYLPARVSIPMFALNHAAFVVGMFILQEDALVLRSHLVNASIVVVVAFVVTKIMFDSRRRVYQAMSVIQSQQANLERLAIEDSLTGLYNRRYADSRLAEEFERASRYSRPFSVAMADIDHFKQVNDTFSHRVGDDVLKRISELLSAELRSVDVVARYGGEEFVIVFPETSEKNAADVCEKMRRSIEKDAWQKISAGLAVTISIGVAGSEVGEDHEGVVTVADDRLYEAKNEGRNRVVRGT